MTTAYLKPYKDLTETDKTVLEASRAVLETGDRLVGPDTDHLNWALSQIVYLLKQHYDLTKTFGAVFVELSIDEAGYGILVQELKKD